MVSKLKGRAAGLDSIFPHCRPGKGIGFKSVFTVSDRAHVLSKVGSQRVGAGHVQDVSSIKNQVFALFSRICLATLTCANL